MGSRQEPAAGPGHTLSPRKREVPGVGSAAGRPTVLPPVRAAHVHTLCAPSCRETVVRHGGVEVPPGAFGGSWKGALAHAASAARLG
jgi:hypothetical protein